MAELLDNLYKLQKKDISRVAPVMRDAFQNDPLWNAIFADEERKEIKLSAFFEMPIRHCFTFGEVYATSENLEGIAAWVSATKAQMTLWRVIRSGGLPLGIKLGTNFGKKMQPIFKQLDYDRKVNTKDRPFIYLQIIGVASRYQHQGLGRQLLEAFFEKYDRVGAPIYLETETEENVAMYERYGFKLIKNIMLPVINLPMWEMVREPVS